MKRTSAVRKVGISGHSVVVSLSREALAALGVKPGDSLYEVITDERTVELQPLPPPSPGARRRRYLSNRVRNLERQNQRRRAAAQAAYQAGLYEGLFKAPEYFARSEFSALLRAAPKLERFLDTGGRGPARETPKGIPTLARSLGLTDGALRGNRRGNAQNKTRRGANGGSGGEENKRGLRGGRARGHGERTTR